MNFREIAAIQAGVAMMISYANRNVPSCQA
jgi:hypothetical protein